MAMTTFADFPDFGLGFRGGQEDSVCRCCVLASTIWFEKYAILPRNYALRTKNKENGKERNKGAKPSLAINIVLADKKSFWKMIINAASTVSGLPHFFGSTSNKGIPHFFTHGDAFRRSHVSAPIVSLNVGVLASYSKGLAAKFDELYVCME